MLYGPDLRLSASCSGGRTPRRTDPGSVLSNDAWLTLAVTAVAVAVMVRGVLPPAATMFGAMAVLLIAGVTTSEQALSGFSNPAPFTIAALFVLARAVDGTGALVPAVQVMLHERGSEARAGLRLLVPTAASSAFLNNTSVVAMLVPAVSNWSDRRGVSPSGYLMPLSFAAILGGMITVMGTSTNLAVSGLLEESAFEPIALFEVAKLGLPIAVAGIVLILLLAPRLLPQREGARSRARSEAREFVVDMVVEARGPLDGAQVEAGGLRHLQGVFLAQIERGGDVIAPVSPTTVLRGDDLLRFVGRADDVVDLQAKEGLISSENGDVAALGGNGRAMYEVVLGPGSPAVGSTLRESEFRGRYRAAVIAIDRAGQRVDSKLGEVRLRVGDTLLLLADEDFRDRWTGSHDFLLISGARVLERERQRLKSAVVGLMVAAVVLLTVTGVTSILEASLLAAIGLVMLGVVRPGEARDAVDLDVIITIAAAFGFAAAIQSSGLADEIATGIVTIFDGLGDRGVLLGLILATILLTELVTNSAAAILVFPIAIAAANSTGLDPRGTAIAVAVAASASFLTPIGYHTNTMVYGPGGYRFLDYARLGAPLTVLVVVIIVLLTPELW